MAKRKRETAGKGQNNKRTARGKAKNKASKMEAYEELLVWAKDKGIILNGVEPRRILGRGMGIENQTILTIPSNTLRTYETVHPSIACALPDISIHGLLAADLAFDPSPSVKYQQWNAVCPTREDVWDSLPLAWDCRLREFLPKKALELLLKQEAKFEKDWSMVQQSKLLSPKSGEKEDESSEEEEGQKLNKTITRDDYLYAWLLVNTRTFYHETPKTKKFKKEDKMVLQPVADLFNHTSYDPSAEEKEGGNKKTCSVAFSPTAFTITTTRPYSAGEEVYICYGNHSNDFLLIEYGFLFDENVWDEVCIDDAILPLLEKFQLPPLTTQPPKKPARRLNERGKKDPKSQSTEKQPPKFPKDLLEETGFLGNYNLDPRNPTGCYRTQVALRAISALSSSTVVPPPPHPTVVPPPPHPPPPPPPP
ncbi:unnamed protein product [Sordaria macrospora k-hell]|uniref:WGS project CABT00000000 data, contig 2.8 n=1 Tax=Sordaria macrospora (strain ATCC MYA-333 / DSM 997 / K(L3346) / K-hell) TaxID=771870 RepID=F7VUV0_SORMK|nr:uncharacterized protein SMAC_09068 [Sordaria macrospora k-hell]CCC09296.1 unnamed protein product [Sordaria macrospora k-hell]